MKTLLLAIFPRGHRENDRNRIRNNQVNALIEKFADGEKVIFLDIGEKFLKDDGILTKEIMPDLLHPSKKGYEIWADAIEEPLKKLLE